MKSMMLACTFAAAAAGFARAEAVPGQDAPAFKSTCTKGTAVALADLKGKYVVLEWTNPGCPFVKKHYGPGNMQAVQKELTGQGVVWLTVNSAAPGKGGHVTAERWNAVAKEQGSAATGLLIDESGEIGRAYGAKTTPHLFVIGPDGKVLYAGAIDDKPSTDAADVAGAVNYVKQAVAEAKAGKPVSVPKTAPYGCGVKY
ncbi:MAG: redoxin domain-containing protein [Lentisphaerae bacterium]|nr:redoxin domain-containing protein [Lentisphaerota bacterium]